MKYGYLLAITCLTLLSCASVAPKNFYILGDSEWLEAAAEQKVDVLVGVGPIELAGYLNRPQLIFQGVDGEVEVITGDVWAEPLEKGIARTLGMNLTAIAPQRAFVYFPWRQDSKPSKSVRVQIHNIFRTVGGVGLQATWVLVDASSETPMLFHHFNRQVSAKSGSNGLVQGLNQLLGLLAQDLESSL